jgi:hypothetical protein
LTIAAFRQLGDIGRDPPRLVAAGQIVTELA